MQKTYTKKERNLYLIGLCGQNLIYSTISAALSYYLQFTLLIPAMMVSSILTINQVLDALKGPFMGSIMDRTRTKWGKARPYLIFTPIPIGILTVLCFANRLYDVNAAAGSAYNLSVVIWAFFIYLLWSFVYTAGDIPITGMPNLMSENEQDRTRLLSLRPIGYLTGSIAIVLVQPLALEIGKRMPDAATDPLNAERMGFLLVVGAFALVATALHQLAACAREHVVASDKVYTLKENFQMMWRNKPFRYMLLSGLLGSPRSVAGVASMPLVTYYYANKDPLLVIVYLCILGSGSVIGQLFAMPLTPKLTERFGKQRVYVAGNLFCVIPCCIFFFLYLAFPLRMTEPLFLITSAISMTLIGTLSGIQNIVSSLFTADAVDYEEYHSQVRPDGVFFSGQTIIVKFSAGISALIGGAAYAAAGFSDAQVEAVNQYIAAGNLARLEPTFAPYMTVLFFLMTIPTAVGCLLSLLPMIRYPLSDAEHSRILQTLVARRQQMPSPEHVSPNPAGLP